MKAKNPLNQPKSPAVRSTFKKAIPFLGILFISMLAFSGKTFAQDKITLSAIQKDATKEVWHKLKTIGAVTVSYQYVDCGPVEFLLFKIDNTSTDKVDVSWKYKQYNNGADVFMNADDANVKYTVNASATLTGACYSENTRLAVFVRESGMVFIITDLELLDFNVTTAQ